MSATALVITIKDKHQNGPPHRFRHVPSPLGLCPQPSLKNQHYSPRFPVEMIHLIPQSSYQAKRSHPCPTHDDPSFPLESRYRRFMFS